MSRRVETQHENFERRLALELLKEWARMRPPRPVSSRRGLVSDENGDESVYDFEYVQFARHSLGQMAAVTDDNRVIHALIGRTIASLTDRSTCDDVNRAMRLLGAQMRAWPRIVLEMRQMR